MITSVALSPSLDIAYEVARLDGIQRPLGVHRVAGGKALNAARAAVALGADVRAVAVLGGPLGTLVADLAAQAGLGVVAVTGSEPTRICITTHAQNGDGVEIYENAATVTPAELAHVRRALAAELAVRDGWCIVSGGLPADLGTGVLSDLVEEARRAHVRIAVDSHGPALAQMIAEQPPDLIKVNRAEAAEALRSDPGTAASALARLLHERTGAAAVVTDGAAGAHAHDSHGAWRAPIPGSTGAHPVGSGDSFLAGLVVALDEGASLPEALRSATGAAAANAQQPGAALLDPNLARDLANQVVVQPE